MKPHIVEQVLMSKLLVVQSKRLLLASAERQAASAGTEHLRQRVERLRREIEIAQSNYKGTMLEFGTPEHADYWRVAYGRLIETGHELTERLRSSLEALPAADRYAVSADVEMLEQIVDRWRESIRDAIAAA